MENDSIRYGDAVCCNTCDTCIYDHGEVLEVSLDANYQMQAKVAWTATGGMEYWPVTKLKKVGGGGKEAESAVCRHKWLVYHGLNETFEYCETCDCRKVNDCVRFAVR